VSEIGQVEVASRRPQKSDAAFRTISEVSEDLDVPQHVLRFWESRFPTIKPLKRGGGRRYYRPEDVQLLRRIRDLLYKDGYTIRGVQKLLREPSRGDILHGDDDPAPISTLPVETAPVEVAPSIAPPPVVLKHATSAPMSAPQVEKPPAVERTIVTAPPTGISGARRALLETLLAEVDELRATLAAALDGKAR